MDSAAVPTKPVKVTSDREGRSISLRAQGGGRKPDSICVIADAHEIIRFHLDGRIKLTTHGRNSNTKLSRINACLPRPYRVRRRLGTSEVYLIDLRRADRPIASFLSSTVFTPRQLGDDEACCPPSARAISAAIEERQAQCA